MDKDLIRKEIIKRRDSLSALSVSEKSSAIYTRLSRLAKFIAARNVLIYASMRSEVVTDYVINHCLLSGKNVYCPVCTNKQEGLMEFVKIQSIDDLVEGYYGIREPLISEKAVIYYGEDIENSICITPGVAFDSNCNRVGYKGGYYDRFFARYPEIYKVALAFDEQIVQGFIEMSEHDIPMDTVITDTLVFDKH